MHETKMVGIEGEFLSRFMEVLVKQQKKCVASLMSHDNNEKFAWVWIILCYKIEYFGAVVDDVIQD